ncbi:ligase-associated DNA damage response endonuclease PdeM [Brevundimonas diminuta]|uniref:Ligase-associated DNA damage response endonuclease PdeM n=1 Tax=Brevundimonas diminuta TaxID=293 RepID=A0A410NT46_BREDI|nr:ligase-associated DNA damage response endonuclease PdeM [Brevundimonas diminuta]MBD3571493.1 ligase-associated DNA damage response endonuclease PdeM [Brevundimonas diminuta]QAT13163.1 ligase-associated DNA damage response endonuclease PdeM [Brevundimonas diminuta]QQB89486.1 ligase-associated DNA damage response endonuclease PdeM [Brevundimonas diminuta]GEC01953.1 metallophosphatase [Brevundimonas diminuta]
MNDALRAALSPYRHPCGGLRLTVNGEPCVLRCSGALWLPTHKTLIASDLHLEKGSAFAARGQMLPPYDSPATLVRLEAEIEALDPRTVILLGDSFHDSKAVSRMDGAQLTRLEILAAGRDWIWLEGNHDLDALAGALAKPFKRLPGRVVETLALGGLFLIHEPQVDPAPGEVAGHLHPAARVAAYGRGVRRPCFVTDGRRLILPAFGAFTGGLDVRDPAITGLFPVPPLTALLGRDKVHAVAFDRLS